MNLLHLEILFLFGKIRFFVCWKCLLEFGVLLYLILGCRSVDLVSIPHTRTTTQPHNHTTRQPHNQITIQPNNQTTKLPNTLSTHDCTSTEVYRALCAQRATKKSDYGIPKSEFFWFVMKVVSHNRCFLGVVCGYKISNNYALLKSPLLSNTVVKVM